MSEEEWKPVLGFEGLYEVSNQGGVRSLPRRTRSGVRGGKVVTPYLRHDGYHEVYLYRESRKRQRLVHHLVLEAFDRTRPEGMETLHGPGGKTDNRWPENIRWGTREQNMGADRVRDHQSNRGEHHWLTHLTWEDVCEIRRLLAEGGVYQYEIADKFGVCKQTITLIKQGRVWAHPPEEW
jgi:DNA-binding XRE family transcriptional regulator